MNNRNSAPADSPNTQPNRAASHDSAQSQSGAAVQSTQSDKIAALQHIIDQSKNIVFFGGAGVSTESGIPDFRSTAGLYNQEWKYPPETILSHTFFEQNTAEFYRFYRAKMLVLDAKPNAAHLKLAELEQCGKLKAVVTQNIDGLHQKAGSKTVYELHGSVLRNYCTVCGAFYDAVYIRDYGNQTTAPNAAHGSAATDAPTANASAQSVPHCNRGTCHGIIKPDVVLYEEGLDNAIINGAVHAIRDADCLIIGGTSLVVYPAASLINYFTGKNLVLINKSATSADSRATLVINDGIAKVLEQIRAR